MIILLVCLCRCVLVCEGVCERACVRGCVLVCEGRCMCVLRYVCVLLVTEMYQICARLWICMQLSHIFQTATKPQQLSTWSPDLNFDRQWQLKNRARWLLDLYIAYMRGLKAHTFTFPFTRMLLEYVCATQNFLTKTNYECIVSQGILFQPVWERTITLSIEIREQLN